MIGRRGFITGLISLVAAPAIVRVASIMPVKRVIGLDFGRAPGMLRDGYMIQLEFSECRRFLIERTPENMTFWHVGMLKKTLNIA